MSTAKPFGRATATLLLGAALLLTALPLALNRGAMFTGSDDEARAAVAELAPGYEPWARPVFSPPGSAVESLLLALQAALGAGMIGYFFGLKRGQRQAAHAAEAPPEQLTPLESQAPHGHD